MKSLKIMVFIICFISLTSLSVKATDEPVSLVISKGSTLIERKAHYTTSSKDEGINQKTPLLFSKPTMLKVSELDASYQIELLKSQGYRVARDYPIYPEGQPDYSWRGTYNIKGLSALAESGSYTPNDPSYSEQNHLHPNNETNLTGSDFVGAWALGEPSSRARVGIIDGGFLTKGYFSDMRMPVAEKSFIHERLGESGWNREEDMSCEMGHGAAVYGVIGAITNNNEGIAGAANVDMVMAQSQLCSLGSFYILSKSIYWLAGIDYFGIEGLEDPVDVINISLGGELECPYYVQDAIDVARSKGIAIITSAGNARNDIVNMAPSNCQGVISVSGINDYSGDLYTSSSYGKGVSISTKGAFIPSFNKVADDYIGNWSGTSFSAPIVAGAYGLAKSHAPSLSGRTLRQLSESTAKALVGPECEMNGCGSGLLDAKSFVEAAIEVQNNGFGFVTPALKSATPCDESLYLTATGLLERLCSSYEFSITPYFDNGKTTFRIMSAPMLEEVTELNTTILAVTSETNFILTDVDTRENQYFFQLCNENEECEENQIYHLNVDIFEPPSYCE